MGSPTFLQLGVSACRKHYKVKYIRLPSYWKNSPSRGGTELLENNQTIQESGPTNSGRMASLPLEGNQERDLLEIIESRHQTASTIFCSQFAPEGWYERIGESTIADAILDRIVHDSHLSSLTVKYYAGEARYQALETPKERTSLEDAGCFLWVLLVHFP